MKTWQLSCLALAVLATLELGALLAQPMRSAHVVTVSFDTRADAGAIALMLTSIFDHNEHNAGVWFEQQRTGPTATIRVHLKSSESAAILTSTARSYLQFTYRDLKHLTVGAQ